MRKTILGIYVATAACNNQSDNEVNCFNEQCVEQECLLNDDFPEKELNQCRWDILFAIEPPIVSTGELTLSEYTVLRSKMSEQYCPSMASLEFRARLMDYGSFGVEAEGLPEVIVYSSGEVHAGCFIPNFLTLFNVNVSEWNKFKIEYGPNVPLDNFIQISINDSPSVYLPRCGEEYIGPIVIAGTSSNAVLSIDYIKELCK